MRLQVEEPPPPQTQLPSQRSLEQVEVVVERMF